MGCIMGFALATVTMIVYLDLVRSCLTCPTRTRQHCGDLFVTFAPALPVPSPQFPCSSFHPLSKLSSHSPDRSWH